MWLDVWTSEEKGVKADVQEAKPLFLYCQVRHFGSHSSGGKRSRADTLSTHSSHFHVCSTTANDKDSLLLITLLNLLTSLLCPVGIAFIYLFFTAL